MVLLGRVIIEKANRDEVELGSLLQFTHDKRTRVACAEGQTAIAGETILARFGGGEGVRQVRVD